MLSSLDYINFKIKLINRDFSHIFISKKKNNKAGVVRVPEFLD